MQGGGSFRRGEVAQVRHFSAALKGRNVPSVGGPNRGGVRRSPQVKVEVSFNLAEGQLYLLTYVNEYRGGPCAKHTHTHTESVSHCSSGVPAWKEKRDVAKSGEYLQPYAPRVISGISETFGYKLEKCVLPLLLFG